MMDTTNASTSYSSYNVKSYFVAKYLADLVGEEILGEDAVSSSIPANLSKTIEWTRVRKAAAKTAATSEGSSPSESYVVTNKVSATIVEYADYASLSSLLSMTTFERLEEITKAYRQGMIETREWVLMKEICSGAGSTIYAKGTAALGDMTYLKTLEVNDLYRMRTLLRTNNNKTFKDGCFRVVVNPRIMQELYSENGGDNPFIKTYQGESGEILRKFAAWKFSGMMIKENTLAGYYVDNAGTQGTASAGAVGTGVYNLLTIPFYGADSFANVKLGEQRKSPYTGVLYNDIIICDKADKTDPTNAYITIGYRFPAVAKVLDTRSVFNLVSADPDYATA